MEAVSLDAFSEESFDAVAWVNGALSAKTADEPLDMHVGELLMRMQLLAQDVQYNLRDSSDLAMMNLPKSQRDMELVQTEAGALHAQTERLKKELEDIWIKRLTVAGATPLYNQAPKGLMERRIQQLITELEGR